MKDLPKRRGLWKKDLQDKENFTCKFCTKVFPTRSALGGHISKSHPGSSASYNHKKTVRDKRWLLRELHTFAMEQYRLKEGDGPVNRNRVKRIKKELVFSEDRFKDLRADIGQAGLRDMASETEVKEDEENYDETERMLEEALATNKRFFKDSKGV